MPYPYPVIIPVEDEKECIIQDGVKYCAEAPAADIPMWAEIILFGGLSIIVISLIAFFAWLIWDTFF